MVTGKKSGIEILLTELKTATCYVSFAYSIGDLETVPFTKAVEAIKNFLQQLCEVTTMILFG